MSYIKTLILEHNIKDAYVIQLFCREKKAINMKTKYSQH